MGKLNDLIDFQAQFQANTHGFFLDLDRWREFVSDYPLSWQRVKFDPNDSSAIPEERGIYVFTARLEGFGLPDHGYIFYVGITGDTSASNLRKRYSQYVRNLKNEDGRPAVFIMLKKWEKDLFFNFVPIPDKKISLAKIESSFINSVAPPINKSGFEATLAAAKAATF